MHLFWVLKLFDMGDERNGLDLGMKIWVFNEYVNPFNEKKGFI